MKVSIFLSLILLLFSSFLSATYYEITVGPDINSYDYTSISNAITYIQTIGDYVESEFAVFVYPDYLGPNRPIVTTYYEDIDVPKTTISIIAVEGPDYTIINTGLDGHTGFHILSDGWGYQEGVAFPYMVHIEGFTIIRDGYNTSTQFSSAIETYSRNTYIKNCKFIQGSSHSFNNSIYSRTDGEKGNWAIQVDSCSFNNSCFDGSYAILMETINSSYRGYNALIKNNSILNCGNGIKTSDVEIVKIFDNDIMNDNFGSYTTCGIEFNQIVEQIFQSFVENNAIENFDLAIKASAAARTPLINNNIIYNNIGGIEVYGLGADIFNNLVYDSNLSESVTALFLDCDTVSFFQNTFVTNENNSTAIDCNNNAYVFHSDYLFNSIFWGFTNILDNFTSTTFEIDYCCLDITPPNNGSNNIINPSIQVFNNASTNDYSLYWNTDVNDSSPCINAGKLDYDRDGIDYKEDNDDRDPDHSRMDIGYKPYELPYDSRYLTSGWNWRSFPNLDLVTGEDYQDLVGTNGFLGYDYNPTIDDFMKMRYEDIDDEYTVEYSFGIFSGHNNLDNKIFRHNGYKIERTSNANDFVLKIYSPDYDNSHEYSFIASQPYWVGYPLDETLRIDEYFDQSSTADFSDIYKIESEDWVYYDDSNGRIKPPPDIRPWGSTPDGKYFEYGQTYIITFNNCIPGFRWDNGIVSGGSSKIVAKAQPTNFTYEEKADYEVFEILSIDDSLNATEIGVFEDGVCVGATVIESLPTQVLAYVSADSSSPEEITFQTSTGLRGDDPKVQEVTIYNQVSDRYESSKQIDQINEINFVKIGKGRSEEIPKKINSIKNYPNPFNPSTIISFYSIQEQQVEVSIFNIKGQKIRTLFDDICQMGKNSIQWEGFDKNDKKVSSGIYFYKVESGNQKIMKKMILLK